jgi:hypothetical protein
MGRVFMGWESAERPLLDKLAGEALAKHPRNFGTHRHVVRLQNESAPELRGIVPFPKDNKAKCIDCGNETDLTGIRKQIEAQTQQPIVT